MDTQFCHTTDFREEVSPITGRKLRVNLDPERVYVSAEAKIPDFASLIQGIEHYWEENAQYWKAPVDIQESIRSFKSVRNLDQCISTIHRLCELTIDHRRPKTAKFYLLFWLTKLWACDLLAMPLSWGKKQAVNCPADGCTMGQRYARIIEPVLAVAHYKPQSENVRVSSLLHRLVRVTQGICELGDLAPNTINKTVFLDFPSRELSTVNLLIRAQVQRYGDKAKTVPESWGHKALQRTKLDPEFKWAIQKDPTLAKWREALIEWSKHTSAISSVLRCGDFLLTYLHRNPAITRDPTQYCHRNYQPPVTLAEANVVKPEAPAYASLNNFAWDFFEWLLDARLSLPDDSGRPVRSPQHCNPVSKLKGPGHAAETDREVLATRYINELVNILTEKDFAWPRQIKTDYISHLNKETGAWERVWCPVRAYAILLKLLLPLRTFQIRVLDSGEADSECYEAGQWIPNNGPLVLASAKPVAKGFLRKFKDKITGKTYTGFFVNTNKTQDRFKDAEDRGYTVPWQNERAIEIAVKLRTWQKTYNPIAGPMNWGDLHDKEICVSRKLELRKRLKTCFLFRDPKGKYINEPVASSRLNSYWRLLMAELQRRVAARGETLPDGSPIRFLVREPRDCHDTPPAIYDLHTLRVSLLTALATDGKVPIHVLSKCLAGHATILMTLYYVKLSVPYITEALARGQKEIAEKEQQDFCRFLQQASYAELETGIASNDTAGVDALRKANPGSWVAGDLGICPVGGGLCHIGGPRPQSRHKAIHEAVPGGPKNCVRCRFFITGPAFLGGLVAHFNAIGVRVQETSERLRARQNEIRLLEDEQLTAEKEGRRFTKSRELNLTFERMSETMTELDLVAHNWHATYGLVERCRVLLKKNADPEGKELSLVLAGRMSDLDLALTETTNFDLYNAVCQVARIYPNEASTVANLRRARIVDAMLVHNGRRPVFATLSEEEALAVGNEFTNFLIARAGRKDTLALMEGKKLLSACGIAKEADDLLAHRIGTAINLPAHPQRPGLAEPPL